MKIHRTLVLRLLCSMLFTIPLLEQSSVSQSTVANQTVAPAERLDRSGATGTDSDRATRRPEILIGGGDLLKVSVFGVKDFDVDVRVSMRGDISLPLVGDVQVGGFTTDEAEAIIATQLAAGNYILHPQVSVFVKEYATQGVSVLGEVEKPGVYPLLGSHQLFDVLSMAGGTTQKSGPTVTITHRSRPDDPVHVTLGDIGKSAHANAEIFPGDTVFVSKAGIVYVVGDVKNPSGIVIENDSEMTVLKAIAIAGGVNSTAAVNSSKLIRRTTNGREENTIPLKKILAAKASDLRLQAEDIVFVPSSAAKGAGRRGLEAILQAATGVAIYRTP